MQTERTPTDARPPSVPRSRSTPCVQRSTIAPPRRDGGHAPTLLMFLTLLTLLTPSRAQESLRQSLAGEQAAGPAKGRLHARLL